MSDVSAVPRASDAEASGLLAPVISQSEISPRARLKAVGSI
jgi:hypothetical protein